MARTTYYVPPISRPLVSALYHQAKHRRMSMTRLVDALLRDSLTGTPGWKTASKDWPELAAHKKDGVSTPT